MGVGFHPDLAISGGVISGTDRILGAVLRKLPTMGDVARYYRDKFGFGTVQRTSSIRGFGTNQLCYGMKYSTGKGIMLAPDALCSHTTPPREFLLYRWANNH